MKKLLIVVALSLLACGRAPEPPADIPPGQSWQCDQYGLCDRTCPFDGTCRFTEGAWCVEIEDGNFRAYQCTETQAACENARRDPIITASYVSLCTFEQ